MFVRKFTVQFDNGSTEFYTLQDMKNFIAFMKDHAKNECDRYYGGAIFLECYFSPLSNEGVVTGIVNNEDVVVMFSNSEFGIHEDVAIVHFE